jgi:predicted nucleotidyltransferase
MEAGMAKNQAINVSDQQRQEFDASSATSASIVNGISVNREAVAAFCLKWSVSELALFGSVLREDFRPQSDVDVLVRFQKNARPTLFDMVRMQNELEGIFGRKVDLVSRRGLEQSRNHIRRNAILQSAEVFHGS